VSGGINDKQTEELSGYFKNL